MELLTEDKDKYISTWRTRDFRDLIWVPVIGSLFLYLQFKSNLNPSLHNRLVPLTLGVLFLFCSKGLSILFNLRWLAFPSHGNEPLASPRRLKIIGLIIIVICVVSLVFR